MVAPERVRADAMVDSGTVMIVADRVVVDNNVRVAIVVGVGVVVVAVGM
jgi:ABC-type bacteriocin/lantibiotic exporter with double-glycine peptidase domain